MSDIDSANFSETAVANSAASPNGAPEGMAPGGVNDTIREVMAAIKREWNRSHPSVTSGGSANAQTLTYATAPAAYVAGQLFSFIAGIANTGAATLNVNGLGARTVLLGGGALTGGELQAGQVVTLAYDGTQFQILSAAPPQASSFGFRNRLYNGGMEIWQRGAGGSAVIAVAASASAYTADRFALITGASQASSVSQVAGLVAQSQWAARIQRNAGQTGSSAMYFEQPFTLDQIVALRGQFLALQFQAAAGAGWSPASGTLNVNIYCGTGAAAKRGGAAYASESNILSKAINLAPGAGAALQTAVTALAVPTNATQMTLQWSWTPSGTAGANDWFALDDVQLEVGGVNTLFERRPFEVELVQCARFYQKSFAYGTAPAQGIGILSGEAFQSAVTAGATQLRIPIFLAPEMRVTPSTTTYNPAAANAQARDEAAGADCSSTSITAFPKIISIVATGAAGTSVGNRIGVHWTCDAEL